ncbi:MAG: hypothetical protein ACT4PL_02995, partial [Phycisphaerales bacterium]
MADIDNRQSQIREGAGLTESKLNTDFIEFLKRWSTPILLVVACTALSFMLYRKYKEHREGQFDAAWVEFQDAEKSRNPATLVAVAETHASVPGLPLIARLQAGDVWRHAAITGVAPGGTLDNNGKIVNPEDQLNAQQRTQMLDKAAEQFTLVLAGAGQRPEMAIHSVPALFRRASVAEMREQWEQAKADYEQAKAIAENAGFPGIVTAAKKRLETLDELKSPIRLYSDSEIMTRPETAKITPVPAPTFDPLPSPIAPPSLGPSIDLNSPLGVQPQMPPTDPVTTPATAPPP